MVQQQTTTMVQATGLEINLNFIIMKTYARKCDITGEGMDEGFCIQDGEMYIKYEEDLIKHLREIEEEKHVTDEWLMSDWHQAGYYYWTEWYDDSDHQYKEVDGEIVEIE